MRYFILIRFLCATSVSLCLRGEPFITTEAQRHRESTEKEFRTEWVNV
jgi:hypothetical protein